MPPRLPTLLTIAVLTVQDRLRNLRDSHDRGSETTDKVMWIALTVALALAAYAIFNGKILAKLNSISL